MVKQLQEALSAAGFGPSINPESPPFTLRLAPPYHVEARINGKQKVIELTVVKTDSLGESVAAIGMCSAARLAPMIEEWRHEIALKKRRRARKSPA